MTRDRDLILSLDDAVNRAEIDEVRALLDIGADVNGRHVVGDTPLMSAAWVAAADVVRLLLSRGADVNARARDGKTALGRVLEVGHDEYGHDEVIQILRAAGAHE
jgi:hypothetical protein